MSSLPKGFFPPHFVSVVSVFYNFYDTTQFCVLCLIVYIITKIFHTFKIAQTSLQIVLESIFIKYSHFTSQVFSLAPSLSFSFSHSLSFSAIGSVYFLLSSHPLCPDTSSSWRRAERAATASEVTWKNSLLDVVLLLPLTSNRYSCFPLKNQDHRATRPYNIIMPFLLYLRGAFL